MRQEQGIRRSGRRGLGHSVSTILPTCMLDSMRAWAWAACASGNVLSTIGLMRFSAISGHTLSSTARDRRLVLDRA